MFSWNTLDAGLAPSSMFWFCEKTWKNINPLNTPYIKRLVGRNLRVELDIPQNKTRDMQIEGMHAILINLARFGEVDAFLIPGETKRAVIRLGQLALLLILDILLEFHGRTRSFRLGHSGTISF